VKPQCELNLFNMLRFASKFFELGEAFLEVPCCMVLAMRLGIASYQLIKHDGVSRRDAQPDPHLLPLG